MLHVYTFISWWNGFTAITQHRGSNIHEAIQHWLHTFNFHLLEKELELTKDQIATLKSDVSAATPISNDSFVSMWFIFSTLGTSDRGFRIDILDTRLPSEGGASLSGVVKRPAII